MTHVREHARIVTKWLEDGMPSFGAPEASIAKLADFSVAHAELLAVLIEIDKRIIFDGTNGFDRAFNERMEAALAKAGAA